MINSFVGHDYSLQYSITRNTDVKTSAMRARSRVKQAGLVVATTFFLIHKRITVHKQHTQVMDQ